MPERSPSEIDRLIQLAKAAAAEHMDLPGAISLIVKSGVDTDAEPYVMLGVLIEGIAHIVAQSIPMEARADVVQAVANMLLDRMAARGLMR
jgi:hypothetical protein